MIRDKRPAPEADDQSPIDSAVALRRDMERSGGHVVAKGYGGDARAIIRRAKEHGIPIHDDEQIVALLLELDLYDHLPESMYLALAELLLWLKSIDDQSNETLE